jgi:propionaldehyde dehydrogenase
VAIQEKQLELIVKAVMEELSRYRPASGAPGAKKNSSGVFEDVDEAVEAAWAAQKEFRKYSLEARERIIRSIKAEISGNGNIELISRMAVEETGMGRVDDKIRKNLLVLNKTPGTEDLKAEAFTGDDGLTLLELSPFGVIGAITPATNPSETVLCNAIGMIAAGNSVVFCSHPTARKTTMKTIEIISQAIRKAEGPENLVTAIANPTMENASAVMKHPKVNMITATGGPGLVKAALSSGKKVIGAGAGNPPVVVDDTADLEQAAKDIVDGASFDNNLPCIAEKEVIVVDNAADYLIFNMQRHGAYLLKDQGKIDELEALVITKEGNANRDFIGKDAEYILSRIGIRPEKPARLIIMETNSEHPFFVEELMMPILPVVRVKNVDEAIELAVKAEHGNRHTAIMHSKNVDHLTKCARDVQTTIFVKNAASYAGIGFGGEGYTTFTIAGPTGEGLTSAKTFTRKRRCVLAGGFLIK